MVILIVMVLCVDAADETFWCETLSWVFPERTRTGRSLPPLTETLDKTSRSCCCCCCCCVVSFFSTQTGERTHRLFSLKTMKGAAHGSMHRGRGQKSKEAEQRGQLDFPSLPKSDWKTHRMKKLQNCLDSFLRYQVLLKKNYRITKYELWVVVV